MPKKISLIFDTCLQYIPTEKNFIYNYGINFEDLKSDLSVLDATLDLSVSSPYCMISSEPTLVTTSIPDVTMQRVCLRASVGRSARDTYWPTYVKMNSIHLLRPLRVQEDRPLQDSVTIRCFFFKILVSTGVTLMPVTAST